MKPFRNAIAPVIHSSRKKVAVSVIGLGYVGAVSAACLTERGHRVIGVDLDKKKVNSLNAGRGPVLEDRLDDMISKARQDDLLSATTDIQEAIRNTDMTFVCVGTPSSESGEVDLGPLRSAIRAIGSALAEKKTYHNVVIRSTIPAGTTRKMLLPILEDASGRYAGADLGVCFHPEFLREGVAVADFYAPPKTVIGAWDRKSADQLSELYNGINAPMIVTTLDTAEMVKVVDNTWHAVKVCFANEIGKVCQSVSVDSHDVMDIFVQDTKLNLSPYYMKPGFSFGGSCLPKDVRAINALGRAQSVDTPLLRSIMPSNSSQLDHVMKMVEASDARRIGLIGLTFKTGTDDLRESPQIELAGRLMARGYDLRCHDPNVRPAGLELAAAYAKASAEEQRLALKRLVTTLCPSLDEMMRWADTIIVSHRTDDVVGALRFRSGAATIIDLVRLPDDIRNRSNCHGICW